MDWMWWLQIGADALLVLAVAMLIFRLKGMGPGDDLPHVEDWAKFIKEASELGQEFDRLLNEKRELVSQVLRGMDERIAVLQELKGNVSQEIKKAPPAVNRSLDRMPAEPAPAPEPEPEPEPGPALSASKLSPEAMDKFRTTVLELAKEGQGASEIAKGTGRPRGEVELILSLNNQDV